MHLFHNSICMVQRLLFELSCNVTEGRIHEAQGHKVSEGAKPRLN